MKLLGGGAATICAYCTVFKTVENSFAKGERKIRLVKWFATHAKINFYKLFY